MFWVRSSLRGISTRFPDAEGCRGGHTRPSAPLTRRTGSEAVELMMDDPVCPEDELPSNNLFD